MKRILMRGLGVTTAALLVCGCDFAIPETNEYTLSYTIPVSGTYPDSSLDTLTFDLQASIGGGFSLHESGCDPGDFAVVGSPDSGYYISASFDPYACGVDDPASPDNGSGNLQVYLDGYFFGMYTSSPIEIDLSPKITLVYYEPGPVTAANVGICNFYFPDADPWFHTRIVEQAATDLGGYVDLLAADEVGATVLTGQIDYNVWFWNLHPGWYFDYYGELVAAFQGDYETDISESNGYGHSMYAQLAHDTHATVYGGVGHRAQFTSLPYDELSSFPADNGLPWCGDVLGIATPYFL